MRSTRVLEAGDRVRVLVVDDSVVMRRTVSLALEADPQIEVIGVASSGELALQKVDQLNPDVVTLDVEMPGMNGLDTLTELRKRRPNLRVVMLSSLTQGGAEVTMEALSRGADDCASKSTGGSSIEESVKLLRDQLCGKIKQFFLFSGSGSTNAAQMASGAAKASVSAAASSANAANSGIAANSGNAANSGIAASSGNAANFIKPNRPAPTATIEAIVLGISTGGPTALAELIPALGADLAVPLLVVQHMPPMFTKLLSQRLNSQSRMTVVEAEQGTAVQPGTVYIAPGDFHMKVKQVGGRVEIHLDQSPPENCCRPAVDVLFRSAAEVWGKHVAAVVMTGMGQDGLAGARTLWAAGSPIFAQDEASSVVWGMPGEIARAGLADRILPLGEIAPALITLNRRTRI